jgi:DNA-binding transcriptional regulator YiaG
MVPLSNERDMTTDEFNAWVRRLGLPEKELARRLETTQPTINRWTTGRRKPPPFLWRALSHLEAELQRERTAR